MVMKFVAFYDIVIGMAISTADFFRAISVAEDIKMGIKFVLFDDRVIGMAISITDFCRAISEDIKMGIAIAIAIAAVCQAMSH